MSRFKGWTAAAVEKVQQRLGNGNPQIEASIGKKKKQKKKYPDYPAYIHEALRQIGIPSVREYQFIKDRKYQIDVAIPEYKIAIEFEGIGNGGRHQRIKGYHNDTEKYNLLTIHQWHLLRYTTLTTKQLNWEYAAALEVKDLIEVIQKKESK